MAEQATPQPASTAIAKKVWAALAPFIALIAVTLFFIVCDLIFASGKFYYFSNLRAIVTSSMTVAIAAMGMTIIIISGGIDLSAGTCMALCAVVLAICLRDLEDWGTWAVLIALLASIAVGCASGCVNGLLIGWGKIMPFIVTLGTMLIFLGLAKQFAENTVVRPNVIPHWLDYMFSISKTAPWMGSGLPMGVWLTLALAVVSHFILTYTVFGRHVFAIGSNEKAAYLSGINVKRRKLLIYGFGGLFVGLSGIARFAEEGGSPIGGEGVELQVIAAVVIGGGSLSGGRGSIWGALAGAVMMKVITSGCTRLGLPNTLQDMVLGALIIAAVVIDQIKHRRSRRDE